MISRESRAIAPRIARRVLAAGLTSVLVIGLAACSGGGNNAGSSGGSAAPAKPIRVGFLSPATGNSASSGQDMVNGWKLWWQSHSDEVAGRKIETIYYDTASDPNTALTRARKAVEQDQVDMIVGPYLANEGLAVAAYTTQNKVPLFLPTVSADDLTQRKANPYVIRVAGWTSSQTTHPAGEWAYDQGYRNVLTIANAYAFGYENAGGFAQTFTEKGGRIIKQIWSPLGTSDYSPYLSQISAAKPDAVFVQMVGADAVHFLEQWKSFGLKDKIPMIGNETLTDQSNIRKLPADVVGGITTFGHYAEGRDDPATKTFVDAYAAAYGVYPSYMAAAAYTNGQWISQAIEQVKGDLSNKEAFLDAMRAVRLENSAFGPMTMDSYGNPVENVYLRQTVPAPDSSKAAVWNVVVKTYPNVSQFWTYRPEEYLKQPVYSDQFQGIKQ